MSLIVLATASADLELRVQRATDGACVTLPLGPLPHSSTALLTELDVDVPPGVIVLDSGEDPQPALELAVDFSQQFPGISIILVSERGPEIGLEAMRAGIRDILDPASAVSDIRQMLDRAGAAAQARAVQPERVDGASAPSPPPAGRVISVVSPKGGVGKTTVATNLAVGLALTGRHSTVLVDLDLQFGDVASALNLDPEHSLPDTVYGPASRDTMVLKTFLTLHETGLYVICGPESPGAADSITTHQVSHLLQMLASEFSYVVVDTGPGLSEHVLAAMDDSSDLVLVTRMDVPGVRGLRKELDALTELGMLSDSRCVVLNFTDSRAGLSVADAEATIGSAVDISLPRSKAILRSVNQGVPLLQSGGRDPMAKALRRLVDRFAPIPVELVKPAPVKGRRKPDPASASARRRTRTRTPSSNSLDSPPGERRMTTLSDRLKATRRDEVDQTPQGSASATGSAAAPRDDRNTTPAAVTSATPTGRSALRPPQAGSDALEKLKDRAAAALFERLGARLNDPSLSESQLHALVRSDLNQVVEEERVPLTSEQRHRLIREVEDDVLGHGPLQRLLDDPRVTEIMVNGPDMIYVEQDGKLVRSSARFTSEGHLRRMIERIVSRVGRRIDESSPLVDARLADGSRVNAIIPPLAFNGSSLTIRKFAQDPYKVDDLIGFGTLTAEMAELLRACVEARLNIIISGGTGTGKTTLLNVLSSFIPDGERIVTIEDAVELQLQQDHVVRLESRPANIEGKGEVGIRDLVRNSLRMRPDRIVVGEVRGGESLDMLQAMNTGHDGSLSTVHANSPRDAIARLETLVLMAGMDLPLRAVREQIASAVDVIVQLSRLRDGTRRVSSVTEVQGMDGQTVILQDAFVFDYAAGVDASGRFLGKPIPTGVRPHFTDKFIELGISLSPQVFAMPVDRPPPR